MNKKTPPTTISQPKHVVVVVLGDFGRSPRMQYHALSLANLPNTKVSIVSYEGSTPRPEVHNHPNITHYLVPPPNVPKTLPFLAYATGKLSLQIFQLLKSFLWTLPSPDLVLVQNPPSIPTLSLLSFICTLRGAVLVIDWHNFGYTLLALTTQNPTILAIAEWYEAFFGQFGDSHLCVTQAMQRFLHKKWGISASVLYDQPPTFFCKTSLQAKHKLFERIDLQSYLNVSDGCPVLSKGRGEEGWGVFTERIVVGKVNGKEKRKEGEEEGEGKGKGKGTEKKREIVIEGDEEVIYQPRPNAPKLVISSTSWTPDEDFSLLLTAIEILDQTPSTPHTIYIITGKGPLQAHYLSLIRSKNLQKSHILTLWVESADYPLILGSGDVGVSLHSSSSGVDLPMKVVDMFGCRLPVCALGFEALPELVRDGENGLVFTTSEELAECLGSLLGEGGREQLERLVKGIEVKSWEEEWGEKAEPLFLARLRSGGGERGVLVGFACCFYFLFACFVFFCLVMMTTHVILKRKSSLFFLIPTAIPPSFFSPSPPTPIITPLPTYSPTRN